MSQNRASATLPLAFTIPKQIKKRLPHGGWSSTGSFGSFLYVLAVSSVASLTTILFQTELAIVANIEFSNMHDDVLSILEIVSDTCDIVSDIRDNVSGTHDIVSGNGDKLDDIHHVVMNQGWSDGTNPPVSNCRPLSITG